MSACRHTPEAINSVAWNEGLCLLCVREALAQAVRERDAALAEVERLTLRVGYLHAQLDPEHEMSVGDCGWCHTEVRDAHVSLGNEAIPYHVECYGHLMKRERDEARALLKEAATMIAGCLYTGSPSVHDLLTRIEAVIKWEATR